jgi:predicted secreted protein
MPVWWYVFRIRTPIIRMIKRKEENHFEVVLIDVTESPVGV